MLAGLWVYVQTMPSFRQYRTPADKHGYQREIARVRRFPGGGQKGLGLQGGSRRGTPAGTRLRTLRLAGDRLYRIGSGVAGRAGYPGMRNGEGAPWLGMPER